MGFVNIYNNNDDDDDDNGDALIDCKFFREIAHLI